MTARDGSKSAAARPAGAAERPVGVVLLNLGGPDRPESVRPFLLELFRDPEVLALRGGAPVRHALAWLIATLRAPKVRRNYASVGGSPLLARTLAQERALEAALNADGAGPRFLVRTAMRYWRPRAAAALDELLAAGIGRLIALPLYPHECRATTGSSVRELAALLATRAPTLPWTAVRSFARDGRYLDALARCVEEGIATARAAAGAAEPLLLFSGHGLPLRIVADGDPYVAEITATIAGVMARLRDFGGIHRLSWQSRAGPVRWLGPTTEATLGRLGAAGVRAVVIVPISFVSDHIETVHEIDVELAEVARAAGITTFVRTPALDVRADFIAALAEQVRDARR
ncbi:MAG: ferrochelatase [Planctomycetes bacterium]|nr:ferrochelatase [Planctomycetota bacterium]